MIGQRSGMHVATDEQSSRGQGSGGGGAYLERFGGGEVMVGHFEIEFI
jgi:hypothetical protein